jgi:hypothetical protein
MMVGGIIRQIFLPIPLTIIPLTSFDLLQPTQQKQFTNPVASKAPFLAEKSGGLSETLSSG